MQTGTLHVHRSVGVVRKDPTITPSPVMCSGSPLWLGSPVGASAGAVSADSSSMVVACCAFACLAGSASCSILFAGAGRTPPTVPTVGGVSRPAVPSLVFAPGLRWLSSLLMTDCLLPRPPVAVRREASVPSSPYCRVPITLQACHLHLPTPALEAPLLSPPSGML